MTPADAQLYVYYRVKGADAPAVIAAVRAMQGDLRLAMPGLLCTLSRRAETGTDLPTLMETYAHPQGVTVGCQRDIEHRAKAALGAWIVGERHVEVFVPCA